MAELYYNGAPGIPKDWNKTLELYVTMMESICMESQESPISAAQFLPNLLEVLDSMQLRGLAPVETRLQAACKLPFWNRLPASRFAALYGSARLAYLQSRLVEAAKTWHQALKMWSELKDQPLMVRFCIEARYQIAKMQNTYDGLGDQSRIDQGMVAIDAERAAGVVELRPAIEAMPNFASFEFGTYNKLKESHRMVAEIKVLAKPGETAEDAAEVARNLFAEGFHETCPHACQDKDVELDFQSSTQVPKRCSGCGKQSLLGEKVDKGSTRESIRLFACAACNRVYYCSKECQKSDWKTHKSSCAKK